jgi:hypothetical protein
MPARPEFGGHYNFIGLPCQLPFTGGLLNSSYHIYVPFELICNGGAFAPVPY